MSKRILYCRCSSLDQRTDRQRVNEKDYDVVIEDHVSGSIPFFDRPGGAQIKELINHKVVGTIHVFTIDRLGRNLLDILSTIKYMTDNRITVYFMSQGLATLDENGNDNPVANLIISILGIVGQMGRSQILEAQKQGIRIAKLRNAYKGRKRGSSEDTLTFLSKPKNKKALQLLKQNYKGVEVAKLLDLNINTVTKIKKLGLSAT